MSYTIEYARKVFKIPEGTVIPAGFGKVEHTLSQDNYFIFTRSGCNNIDPRPEHWHLSAFGWSYQVISTICERAGWTEGGGLKFPSGDTSPESYLKLYRREIKSAQIFSLLSLQQSTGIYGGYFCIDNKHGLPANQVSKSIDKIKKWFTPYGEYFDYFRYDIRFSTMDHFRAFLSYQHIVKEMGGLAGVQSYQNK